MLSSHLGVIAKPSIFVFPLGWGKLYSFFVTNFRSPETIDVDKFDDSEMEIHFEMLNLMVIQIQEHCVTIDFHALRKVKANPLETTVINHNIILCTSQVKYEGRCDRNVKR